MSECLATPAPFQMRSLHSGKKCALCGLSVGFSKASQTIHGEVFHFCCLGCLNVFQILMSRPDGPTLHFRETDLYRICVQLGLISRNENGPTERESGTDEKTPLPSEFLERRTAEELTLRIDGTWCPACSWVIEAVLRKTKGILEANVLFPSDLARIKYRPEEMSPREILSQISKLGYRPFLFLDPSERSPERRNLLLRLGISSILTMNVMMISFCLYSGFFEALGPEGIRCLSYPLWFLSTLVLFYGGVPLFKRTYVGLRHASLFMDALVLVGALSAYSYSVIQINKGSLHLYFDTTSMLITLVLLGKHIETRAREKVSMGITELYELARQKVRLFANGLEKWVSSEAIVPGELFLVLEGERVPIDGRIISGRAKVDESILTGESKPVTRGIGEEITGGTRVLEKELTLEATRVGPESSLGQMIKLIEEALVRKNPFELLSDRIVQWLVPAVFVLAAGTMLFLWLRRVPMDVALLRAVTVLVITCPCALGIASPLAKVAAIGKGRKRGILIRDPGALEKAKDLDLLIFDKTGTMTHGNFSLQEVIANGVTIEKALLLIAAVEIHSDHFLAREIIRKAKEMAIEVKEAQSFETFEGLGVKGSVEGREVLVGNEQFMKMLGMELPSDLEQKRFVLESKGITVVFFAWEGQAHGILAFGDSLKENSGKTVQGLQGMGIEVWLVSGDAEETTRVVAEELGIDRFAGNTLPKEKVEMIRTLQEKGHCVGMVGDGLNDAPALAQADVGFALGAGARIGREASDITLMIEDPYRVIEALDLSKTTVRTVRQNLLFAFVYNGLGIPLAVAGFLNPLIAAFFMLTSSLSVIGNSFRISKGSSP